MKWALSIFLVVASLQALVIAFGVDHANFWTASALLGILLSMTLLVPFAAGRAMKNWLAFWKKATLWHGLWILLFLSSQVFRVRDANTIRDEALDGWALYRVALVGIVAAALLVRFARRPWIHSLFRGFIGFLALYAIVATISATWSVYPLWTLYKSLEYLVDVSLFAAILFEVRSVAAYKSIFDMIWLIAFAGVAVVYLGVVFWPQDAFLWGVGMLGLQLRGVIPAVSANGVGDMGALLAIVGCSRLISKRGPLPNQGFWQLLFVFGLIALIFSQTRSAIAGFALGVVLLFLLTKRIGLVFASLLMGCVLFSLTNAGEVMWEYLLRGQSPKQLHNFTGRLEWWEFGIDRFLERPLTGYGAYAGGRFAVLAAKGDVWVSNMHNAYLEILLGTGFWGLLPILAALLGTWGTLFRRLRHRACKGVERELVIESMAILCLFTVRSVFAPGLVWHPSLEFICLVGYAELLRRRAAAVRVHRPAMVGAGHPPRVSRLRPSVARGRLRLSIP